MGTTTKMWGIRNRVKGGRGKVRKKGRRKKEAEEEEMEESMER